MPRAVCMLSNTTAIAEAWARLDHKFDLMYAKVRILLKTGLLGTPYFLFPKIYLLLFFQTIKYDKFDMRGKVCRRISM